ncbi:lipoprotein [Spiroplasma endosymbiont of Anurida maritima]|uniref:lipoprotein n=1 Tax=Spiroplasma endosymbiont of Anurida maritima TaxID=2967972 RepID=UPI0036D2CE25
MKKLLNILGSLTFTVSTVATVVACGTEVSSSPYKDSEINDIKNKNIVSQVRSTSQLAKIMIGGRHENGNYNSVPMYGFFNSSSPHFKLNNGEEVDFSLEKADLLKLQPELRDKNPIDGQMRRPQSSYYYEKGAHNKGLVREGKSYNYNDNIWSYYDTGALTNYTMLNNEKMKKNFVDDGNYFWDVKKGAGFLTEELFNSNLYNSEKSMFEYEVQDKLISYGKQSTSPVYGSYKKSGVGVIDLLISTLQSFGQGSEFISLSGLNQILPILKSNDPNGEKNNFSLVLAVAGILYYNFSNNWLSDSDNLTYVGVNFFEDETQELLKKVKEVADASLTISAITLMSNSGGLFGNSNVDTIMEKIMTLGNLYKEIFATAKENLDLEKLNSSIGNYLGDSIKAIIGDVGGVVNPQPKAFLLFFADAFKSKDFPTTKIISLLGNLYKPFLSLKEGSTYEYTKNKDFELEVKNLYEYSESDYNPNIAEIDPTSNYAKKIKEVHGVIINEDETESYKENSIFGSLNSMANDPNNEFYQGIQEAVYSENGFFKQLFGDISNNIEKSWFDLVFMDKNWDIKADGIGVNNTKLGLYSNAKIPAKDGKLIETSSITYQLDYYGPKDKSTDLSLHEKEINHVDAKNIPDYIKNLSPEEQMKYDGLGNEYMNNSDEVKYSYIVTIANTSSDEDNANWKFVDFEWYYNNQRFY